ncbi:hypothetical protein TGRH88_045610 [Toxoplasma gondii]|uniref:Uncharacterized protein n=3 Tax=Toxoplasma gondii TaxID=5811 RepID=A0A2T6J0T7_TOXGO|nr:hypothetical protein TGRH88_045610 [Toxoplasma gondii]KFG42804.1 hypothetical protein TGP89_225958 [Toxoplasma gondii p89]PUA91195.1 hypothetical protein TGBR9_225958 [Toxoplasma gondii TgCATBr9]
MESGWAINSFRHTNSNVSQREKKGKAVDNICILPVQARQQAGSTVFACSSGSSEFWHGHTVALISLFGSFTVEVRQRHRGTRRNRLSRSFLQFSIPATGKRSVL